MTYNVFSGTLNPTHFTPPEHVVFVSASFVDLGRSSIRRRGGAAAVQRPAGRRDADGASRRRPDDGPAEIRPPDSEQRRRVEVLRPSGRRRGEERPPRLRERAQRAVVTDTGRMLRLGPRSAARRTVHAGPDGGPSRSEAGAARRVHLLRRGVAAARYWFTAK